MSAASRKSPSPARQKPAGRPPGSDSERSHDALLAAARLHFARRGFGPANVREIAEAAGYTTSTLYHYFGDKQGLYVEVYRDAERRIADAYRPVVDGPGSRQERLLALLDAAIELHRVYESVPLFMAAVPLDIRRHSELGAVIRAMRIDTPAILNRLVAGASTPRALASLLMSVTVGMALTAGEGGHRAYAAMLRACGAHLQLDEAVRPQG